MERRTFSIMFLFRRSKLRKNLEAPIMIRLGSVISSLKKDFHYIYFNIYISVNHPNG